MISKTLPTLNIIYMIKNKIPRYFYYQILSFIHPFKTVILPFYLPFYILNPNKYMLTEASLN